MNGVSPQRRFSLRVPSLGDPISVSSFRGHEELSALFRFDIRLTSPDLDGALAAALLDAPASLIFHDADGATRAVHGLIARAASHGRFLNDRQSVQITLVPALWRLRRRRTRRIFQERSTLEIAAILFTEWGVTGRVAVERATPKRDYCVQYDESDYAFLMRLLAEEGFYYYFEHPLPLEDVSSSEGLDATVVIAETAASYPEIAGDTLLSFHRAAGDSGLVPREDSVSSFVPKLRVRSRRALTRGYDFRRPRTELRSEAGSPAHATDVVYDHEGSYEHDLDHRVAQVNLDQERRKAMLVDGASHCRRLAPGHVFRLDGHELPTVDARYVVTQVSHEGYSAEVQPPGRASYQNTFQCASADFPIRAAKRHPKPKQVAETAVVVGPTNQEIHTDVHGRIKVQFHWDLEGRNDEKSSCWVRVAQAWAGAGWGAQFIPRVGMEVVVTFLGGDMDRPLVTGCVYNVTHTLPFALPTDKTRSGIRTSSTPNGEGHNELSFVDAAGSEQIYVHAQKDYDEVIEDNQTSFVKGARVTTTGRDSTEQTGNDRTIVIGRDATTTVRGQARFTVDGNCAQNIHGSSTLEVGESFAVVVDKHNSIDVGGNRALVVGRPDQPASSDHTVYGSASLGASERVTIRADERLILECGRSSIELTPTSIVLHAPTVELRPTDALGASTRNGPSLAITDKVEILAKRLALFTESAALEVDRDFKATGAAIKLGYDPSKPQGAEDSSVVETKPFICKFSDYFLRPYGDKVYHILVEGLRIEGRSDKDGNVRARIPKTAKQVTVRLWIEEYPEGRQRQYVLNLKDVPPLDDVLGVKARLKSLGYYEGPMSAVVDDGLRAAIREFQDDHRDTHGLEPTGNVGEETLGALEEIYGS